MNLTPFVPFVEKLFTGDENLYLDDMPVAITISGALSYLETDHLGTPRIAANPATNAQQWKWDFFADAFGGNAATIAPSGGIDVKLRYPGQQFDSETGLHYNYFRDYEAGTGRYVESDPIGLDSGINTYSYVTGNPLSWFDPLGLRRVCRNVPKPLFDDIGRGSVQVGTYLGRECRDVPDLPQTDYQCEAECYNSYNKCTFVVDILPQVATGVCFLLSGGRNGGATGFGLGGACGAYTSTIDLDVGHRGCERAFKTNMKTCTKSAK